MEKVIGSLVAMIVVLVVVLVIGVACEELEKRNGEVIPVSKNVQAEKGNRFLAESFGKFKGGYNSNYREIFIITDSANGHKYLAITGCGATELHTETTSNGKSTQTKLEEE